METTIFAALLAGVGLAIGAAWSGLLGNFAAGAFIVIFRPFKVEDYMIAAWVEGTVERNDHNRRHGGIWLRGGGWYRLRDPGRWIIVNG